MPYLFIASCVLHRFLHSDFRFLISYKTTITKDFTVREMRLLEFCFFAACFNFLTCPSTSGRSQIRIKMAPDLDILGSGKNLHIC